MAIAIPTLQKILVSNNFLRLVSLCCGSLAWSMLSDIPTNTKTCHVPVSFYNTNDQNTVTAPEYVMVTIAGKRNDLRDLDYKKLLVHIDAQECKEEKTTILITEKHLLLPPSINLISYSPIICSKTTHDSAREIA